MLFKKYLTTFDVVNVPVLLHVLYSRVLCYYIKKFVTMWQYCSTCFRFAILEITQLLVSICDDFLCMLMGK